MTPDTLRVVSLGLRVVLIFLIACVAIYGRRLKKRIREKIARNWPSVEGVIVGVAVAPIPKTPRFHATLQYTYFVDEYRLGTYMHEFKKEADADDFVRRLRNKHVLIRYKQSNPDKSVLEQRVVEQHTPLTHNFG